MKERPTLRHSFLGPADELNYLSDWIRYFDLHKQMEHPNKAIVLRRFEGLLRDSGIDDGSIMLQDHWALFHEVQGDAQKAILHRKREIELIQELFAIQGPVGPINSEYLRQTIKSLIEDYARVGEQENTVQIARWLKELNEKRDSHLL